MVGHEGVAHEDEPDGLGHAGGKEVDVGTEPPDEERRSEESDSHCAVEEPVHEARERPPSPAPFGEEVHEEQVGPGGIQGQVAVTVPVQAGDDETDAEGYVDDQVRGPAHAVPLRLYSCVTAQVPL